MGKTYVKNGTPVGNENLCRNCSNAQITTGYRESDMLVICTNVYPSIAVPFVVHQCTDFEDKFKPDWRQMEKLAIEIQPVRISRRRREDSVQLQRSRNSWSMSRRRLMKTTKTRSSRTWMRLH